MRVYGLARKSPVTAVELVNGRSSSENALWRIKKQTPSWKKEKKEKEKTSVTRNLLWKMNRSAKKMQVTICLEMSEGHFCVFLALDESEERKSVIDVMLITLWCLMQCCDVEMKGLRREIVMIGVSSPDNFRRNNHFFSWGSREKRKEARGQSQRTHLLGRLPWTSSQQMRRHGGWQALSYQWHWVCQGGKQGRGRRQNLCQCPITWGQGSRGESPLLQV